MFVTADRRPGLVVTADDFGRDPATNAFIVEALTRGLITSTTLLVPSPAAQDALDRYEAAGLGPEHLRLHACLTSPSEGPRYRPLTGAPHLVDTDGALPVSPLRAENRAGRQEVMAEVGAQHEWMVRRGHRPAGLDSHSGVLYGILGPSRLTEVLHLCAREGMALRLPRDPAGTLGPASILWRAALRRRCTEADRLGVALPELAASRHWTGRRTHRYSQLRAYYLRVLAGLPARGTSEVFLHPSPAAAGAGHLRLWEARLLHDPAWRAALEGFDLRTTW